MFCIMGQKTFALNHITLLYGQVRNTYSARDLIEPRVVERAVQIHSLNVFNSVTKRIAQIQHLPLSRALYILSRLYTPA